MAGSKKYFVYTTDSAVEFAALLDESNTEAVNGTTGDYTSTTAIEFTIPKNVRPRKAVYANAAGTRKISCTVLTQDAYTTIQTDKPTIPDPIAGSGTLALVQKIPERVTIPIAADTGLNDGDDT